jgi:hypothetical protein
MTILHPRIPSVSPPNTRFLPAVTALIFAIGIFAQEPWWPYRDVLEQLITAGANLEGRFSAFSHIGGGDILGEADSLLDLIDSSTATVNSLLGPLNLEDTLTIEWLVECLVTVIQTATDVAISRKSVYATHPGLTDGIFAAFLDLKPAYQEFFDAFAAKVDPGTAFVVELADLMASEIQQAIDAYSN